MTTASWLAILLIGCIAAGVTSQDEGIVVGGTGEAQHSIEDDGQRRADYAGRCGPGGVHIRLRDRVKEADYLVQRDVQPLRWQPCADQPVLAG